jgi:hypothetical protein
MTLLPSPHRVVDFRRFSANLQDRRTPLAIALPLNRLHFFLRRYPSATADRQR